jgi:hypothetical protein
VHHRDFPLVDTVMDSRGVHSIFSCHRVSPDLSAMASPTLVVDPSDVARRVVESNLRVVWRGSQRVNLSVCMYVWLVCMYVTLKCGGIVGGGGTIKQFILQVLCSLSFPLYLQLTTLKLTKTCLGVVSIYFVRLWSFSCIQKLSVTCLSLIKLEEIEHVKNSTQD